MDNPISKVLNQLLDLNNTQAPVVGPIRKFNYDTFGKPGYMSNDPQQRSMAIMAMLGTGGKGVNVSDKAISNAAKLLKGKSGVNPQDVNTMGHFSEMVERGGGKANMGQTGQDIQSLIQNLFGRDAASTWSNKQIQQVLDTVLMKAQGVR